MMVPIIICEDDDLQRNVIEDIIKKDIMIENYDMKIQLSSSNVNDILNYIEKNKNIQGIYFLDIDFKQKINGIELASIIRKNDVDSKIIFITSYYEMWNLTFSYKIEALDFIKKEDKEILIKKIKNCLKNSYDYYIQKNDNINRLSLKVNNELRFFDLDNIYFFETTSTPHKINMHLNENFILFNGSLKDIEKKSKNFLRVHKSILVNKNNIALIINSEQKIIMKNGEECIISRQGLKLLKKVLK